MASSREKVRVNLEFGLSLALIAALACTLKLAPGAYASDRDRVPILIELFTSEGCSTCPPADLFLQALDGQPIAGVDLIVLSEHVDYWDRQGWKDPFSSAAFSDRQGTYARQFHLRDYYTPQMVLDGCRQFSGNNVKEAEKAIAESLAQPKIAVRVSEISAGKNLVRARLETGALDSSFNLRSVEVYVALALNRAESQVERGENAKRRLTHTAVVKKLVKVGKIRVGEQFAQVIELKTESGADSHNLRLVAFLQDPASHRVVGASMKTVDVPGPSAPETSSQ